MMEALGGLHRASLLQLANSNGSALIPRQNVVGMGKGLLCHFPASSHGAEDNSITVYQT
jgi:hypothetical protein